MRWAVDLWPYVNGKTLMSGINLKEMEASDMLDVIHYLFEDDNHYVSEESAKSRSGLRTSIYRSLYNTTYPYPYQDAEASGRRAHIDDTELGVSESLPEPFNPKKDMPTKGFVPATEFDPDAQTPFSALDGPMS